MDAGSGEFLKQCHWPALPPATEAPLVVCDAHPCPYLPGKFMQARAFCADALPPDVYHAYMDAGFRRSGTIIYQPICRSCRQCRQLRVAVGEFRPSKSQRRCRRRNGEITVQVGRPGTDDERLNLYQRYQQQWHGGPRPGREELDRFLRQTPVDTIEMAYRDRAGKLLAVGICDLCSQSLSSVYCYFDPDEAWRGLGTLAILHEIALAGEMGIPWYYLGFWIEACPSMAYKATFRPAQFLDLDGRWRSVRDSGVHCAEAAGSST